ncbi:MAG: hypothetical protein AABX82_04330 [Nanoarchaeota archaeon]
MGWFSKTLTDAQKAIQEGDWAKVKMILDKHGEYVFLNAEKEVKLDIAEMAFRIQSYRDAINMASRALKSKLEKRATGADDIIEVKTVEALNHAILFERILLDLMKISKKLK